MLDRHYAQIDELIKCGKGGDSEAIYELLQFYHLLTGAAIQRCIHRQPKLASFREDLNAELFTILYELVQQYDSSLSYFSYYLSTRIDYAILAKSRKFLGQTISGDGVTELSFDQMPAGWEPESLDDPFGRILERDRVETARARLKPTQREAIELYYYQEINQKAAADLLGITQASFCKRLQRGLAQLKIFLSEDATE